MSPRGKSSRSILEKAVLIFLTVFVAGTCSIWQENVRPKLYVELGKSRLFSRSKLYFSSQQKQPTSKLIKGLTIRLKTEVFHVE